MTRTSDVSEALATLQARWGAAAPRRGSELAGMVEGALARKPMPLEEPVGDAVATPATPAADLDGRVVSTGFTALDAVLGTGGLPRSATVALRGDASSGKTTVALRLAAEAQAGGAIVAWLDLARAFDPVEAVARGISPEWLVVLTPADIEEALALAGSLLTARTVDLLVLDLPDGRDPAVAGKRVGDRLGRLAAMARRAGTLVVVLEPDALGRTLAAAVEEASGLRLELRRSGWIRLGRDVVGQRSEATVARNRYGPPGRRADLEILYAEGGPRDACLRRPGLLDGLTAPAAPPGIAASPLLIHLKGPPPSAETHAPSVPALAPPAPPPGEGPFGGAPERGGVPEQHVPDRPSLRLLASRPHRPRRTALDGRDGGGRGSDRPRARRPAGDPARDRPPAGARGDLPRPRA